MGRKASEVPTSTELQILSALWDLGPSTVREVFREISRTRDIGYSTVLKMMQIVTEKGYAERDADVRPQVYKASTTRKQTQRHLLRDLVQRAFDGSPGELALQALSTRKASLDERKKIRELLDRIEEAES
jgi:BlaI family penicillinase repressor